MSKKRKKGHQWKKIKPIEERQAYPVTEEADIATGMNPYLKETILEVVENQLRDNNPPETRQTLERLLANGYSRQQAVEMIGSVVVSEIWYVLKEEENYDPVRYRGALEKLE